MASSGFAAIELLQTHSVLSMPRWSRLQAAAGLTFQLVPVVPGADRLSSMTEPLRYRPVGLAQQALDASDQLQRVEGFHQIIVGAEFESTHHVVLLLARRE